MLISKWFHLEEFTTSEVAARAGREIIAPPDVLASLTRLANQCLDPIRDAVGMPMHVTSGYRPDWLNAMIGGVANSAHQWGGAADVIVPGMTNVELARKALEVLTGPAFPIFDQIILEFPPGGWVHIGQSQAGMQRAQSLTALHVAGATRYYSGFLEHIEQGA